MFENLTDQSEILQSNTLLFRCIGCRFLNFLGGVGSLCATFKGLGSVDVLQYHSGLEIVNYQMLFCLACTSKNFRQSWVCWD
jgi:hypothetical protein